MISRPNWDDSNALAWRRWWNSVPKDELAAHSLDPQPGTRISEPAAVMIALAAALKGTGFVSPNPLVGCAILNKEGRFLNSGAHLRVGENHAEIQALEGIQSADLHGAMVYVTLEPCAHHGRTPPCAKALAALPLNSVRYLLEDPDPRVSGAGARSIADAGISVQHLGEWSDLSEDLTEIFLVNHREHRPFVGLKVAATSAGIYALPGSSRYWITGARARDYGHYLRMRYDGILVGASTVLLDRPSLNVRHPDLKSRMPWQFILDPTGRAWDSDQSLPLRQQGNPKLIWFTATNSHLSRYVDTKFSGQIVALPLSQEGAFDWQDILKEVHRVGCKSILVEGGAHVWQSALSHKIVDKVHWFVAPDRLELVNGLKWGQPTWFEQKKNFSFKLDQDDYYEFGGRV